MKPSRTKVADERAAHGGGVYGLKWKDVERKSSDQPSANPFDAGSLGT